MARLAIGIGMGLAGIGGMLVGLDTSIDPLVGFRAILSVFAAAVVGGLGSIPGAVVGGLAIGLAEELSLLALPATYKSAVGFLAILVDPHAAPAGLLGARRAHDPEKWNRFSDRSCASEHDQLPHRDGDLRRDLRDPRARAQRDVGHGRDGQSRHRRLLRLRRLHLGAAHREGARADRARLRRRDDRHRADGRAGDARHHAAARRLSRHRHARLRRGGAHRRRERDLADHAAPTAFPASRSR